MWPSQGYWQQWQQPLYSANPMPQQTDPSDWAAKAAQWAQQRQIQEQYFQQLTQWQQQMVPQEQAPPPEQTPNLGQPIQSLISPPQPQPQAMFQQQQYVTQAQAPTLNMNTPHHQVEPLQASSLHHEQPVGHQQEEPREFDRFARGENFQGEPPQQQQKEFHPRGNFGHRPSFQPRGGSEFPFRGPHSDGPPRPRGQYVFESRERAPPPRHWEKAQRPSHMESERDFGAAHDRDNRHPLPPTEEMFRDKQHSFKGFHPRKEFPSGGAPMHGFEKLEGEEDEFGEQGEYPMMEEYRDRGRKSRWEREDDEQYEEQSAQYEEESEQFEEQSGEQGEQYQQQDEQYQQQDGRYGHRGGRYEEQSERYVDQEGQYGERKEEDGYRNKLERRQFKQEVSQHDTEGEWLYGHHEEHQRETEARFDLSRGKHPYHDEPQYQQDQRDRTGRRFDRDQEPFVKQEIKREPDEGLQFARTSVKDEATLSSLRKDSAFIPGLGGFEKEETPVGPPAQSGTKEEPKAANQTTSNNPTNQMIESLGKIVSQLQTLQGLTSSLQLLQALPKGQQEAVKAAAERMRETDGGGGGGGRGGSGGQQTERELSEETKRKVAALLASESDSDGEQGGNVKGREEMEMKVETTQGGVEDSSPPAREFDGTFNVKPQVYGIYLNQDQYEGGEGGGRGGEQSEEYRRGEFRDRRYDPPPHPSHHERERPHGYNYPPPPHPHPPRDFPYSPEPEHGSRPLSSGGMQFVSRDYSHGQGRHYDEAEYDGGRLPPSNDREDQFGREYPPPSEHFRGTSPPQRERDREPPLQRDRPSISSQMESIDYSHGGLPPNVQSVDYHHGQPSGPPYHGRPPPPGYYDQPPPGYPPSPGYGPGGYPPYEEGFHPPPPHQYPFGGAGGGYFPGLDPATLFAAYAGQGGETKRKTLPSWLREELEKMEHQRQKKLEKEAKDAARRERSNRPTWRDELDEEEEKEEGGERRRTSRSYRYSHSKSPSTTKSENEEERSPPRHRRRHVVEQPLEEEEDEEDKQLKLIMRIRKLLTEILLEVTNQEIEMVASEAIEEAKKPKLTFPLKGQQSLPTKENVLGLNMYASESESERSDIDDEQQKSRKTGSKPPRVDLLAIAEAFRDTGSKEKDQEREKGRDTEGTSKEKHGKGKEKEKEREKLKKEQTPDRRGSDDKHKKSGSREKGREKDKEGSSKHTSSSSSSGSKSRRRSRSPSPHHSSKQKTKAYSRSRSRSPSRSSRKDPKESRVPSSTRKSSSSKANKSPLQDEAEVPMSARMSFGKKARSPSPSPPSIKKRSRHHRSRSSSLSPSPPSKGGRGGRSVQTRSRSRSPNRSKYSKWSSKSSPTRTPVVTKQIVTKYRN